MQQEDSDTMFKVHNILGQSVQEIGQKIHKVKNNRIKICPIPMCKQTFHKKN